MSNDIDPQSVVSGGSGMGPSRRRWLTGIGAAVICGPGILGGAVAATEFDFSSQLIYLSPQKSDGSNSRCQAEIWFADVGAELFVVTARDAWRAQALRQGLPLARIWVGDVGEWGNSNGAYRQLPQLMTRGRIETESAVQQQVLAKMGTKYVSEWGRWGPRFRKGLADGSRVMLGYRPLG